MGIHVHVSVWYASSLSLFFSLLPLSLSLSLFLSLSFLFSPLVPEATSIVLALNVLSPPYYAGLRRDLQCSVGSLYTYNDPTVTVSINFFFNGTAITTSNSRRVLRNQESNNNGAFRRTLQFYYFVSSEDSGLYTCMVNVSSSYSSSFIVNSSISRTNEYTIVGKLICVCVYMYVRISHEIFNKALKYFIKVLNF